MKNLKIAPLQGNNNLLVLSLLDSSEECYILKDKLKVSGTISPFYDSIIKILKEQKKEKPELINAIIELKKIPKEAGDFMEMVKKLI